MPYLFSYGTLQKEKVQLETFGRILKGQKDVLMEYKLDKIEITNAEVLKMSEEKFHPIITYSGDKKDQVVGTLFEVTDKEVLNADEYEVDDYKRVEVTFKSNKKGFIYVKND